MTNMTRTPEAAEQELRECREMVRKVSEELQNTPVRLAVCSFALGKALACTWSLPFPMRSFSLLRMRFFFFLVRSIALLRSPQLVTDPGARAFGERLFGARQRSCCRPSSTRRGPPWARCGISRRRQPTPIARRRTGGRWRNGEGSFLSPNQTPMLSRGKLVFLFFLVLWCWK